MSNIGTLFSDRCLFSLCVCCVSLNLNLKVSLQERGLIVYAKVSKGSRPVVDAKVIAKITPVSDQSETQLCIDLRDNGAGDPDVTKDDGVYSRYVEGIKNLGRHRLVVEAKSEGNAAVLRGATVPGEMIIFRCNSYNI